MSNVLVCIISCVCDVPSLLSNVTLYPFGATGFSISVVTLYAPSTVCDVVLFCHVPPFGFTVNSYFISSQCAYNVIASVGK